MRGDRKAFRWFLIAFYQEGTFTYILIFPRPSCLSSCQKGRRLKASFCLWDHEDRQTESDHELISKPIDFIIDSSRDVGEDHEQINKWTKTINEHLQKSFFRVNIPDSWTEFEVPEEEMSLGVSSSRGSLEGLIPNSCLRDSKKGIIFKFWSLRPLFLSLFVKTFESNYKILVMLCIGSLP